MENENILKIEKYKKFIYKKRQHIDARELEKIQAISEQAGISFDREAYLEATQRPPEFGYPDTPSEKFEDAFSGYKDLGFIDAALPKNDHLNQYKKQIDRVLDIMKKGKEEERKLKIAALDALLDEKYREGIENLELASKTYATKIFLRENTETFKDMWLDENKPS